MTKHLRDFITTRRVASFNGSRGSNTNVHVTLKSLMTADGSCFNIKLFDVITGEQNSVTLPHDELRRMGQYLVHQSEAMVRRAADFSEAKAAAEEVAKPKGVDPQTVPAGTKVRKLDSKGTPLSVVTIVDVGRGPGEIEKQYVRSGASIFRFQSRDRVEVVSPVAPAVESPFTDAIHPLVGDQIVIVKPYEGEPYKKGQVLTVKSVETDGWVYTEEGNWYIDIAEFAIVKASYLSVGDTVVATDKVPTGFWWNPGMVGRLVRQAYGDNFDVFFKQNGSEDRGAVTKDEGLVVPVIPESVPE